MATLEDNGVELLRHEGTTCRLSYRSNGYVLRDNGDGWKRWRRAKEGADWLAFIEERRKEYNNPPDNFFWREKYRTLLIAQSKSLEKRQMINCLIETLGFDLDGLWAELDDNGFRIELDDLKELVEAYNNRSKEIKENSNI